MDRLLVNIEAAETASGCISISNIKGYFMYIQIKPSFVGTYIEILSSLRIFGGFYHEWYIGLTSDSKYSFLEVHNLNLLETEWILSNKTDLPVLNFLKKIFVQMGCKNNSFLDMKMPDQIYLFRVVGVAPMALKD